MITELTKNGALKLLVWGGVEKEYILVDVPSQGLLSEN
jgi:hypothetical protein